MWITFFHHVRYNEITILLGIWDDNCARECSHQGIGGR
jgi:hypothetical protein